MHDCSYKTWGDHRSDPLFLLHGFLGSSADWAEVAQRLSHSYFVVALDLSFSVVPEYALSYDCVSKEVLRIIDKIVPARRVVLGGYSLGARLSLATYLDAPGRFSKLILESCNPGIEDRDRRQERARLDLERSEQLIKEGLQSFVESWYEQPLFVSLQNEPHRFKRLKQDRINLNNQDRAAKVLRELSPGVVPSMWGELKKIDLPTLLISGKLDRKYSEISSRVSQLVPELKWKEVPGAGHNIHFEKPQSWAQTVLEFLAD